MITRDKTRAIFVDDIQIGGNDKIIIQSMCNTKTKDIEATINQIKQLEEAGCEIVRVAVLDKEDAKAIKSINKKYKKKYLKGRTIPGINSEISWHYRAYYLGILVNHANPADLGSTDKKNSGYDSNAWIFEPKIDWGDEKI